MIASQPIVVYNRPRGYIANAFLLVGTAPPTKGTLAQDAHKTAMGTKIHLTIGFETNKKIMATRSRGNKQ